MGFLFERFGGVKEDSPNHTTGFCMHQSSHGGYEFFSRESDKTLYVRQLDISSFPYPLLAQKSPTGVEHVKSTSFMLSTMLGCIFLCTNNATSSIWLRPTTYRTASCKNSDGR